MWRFCCDGGGFGGLCRRLGVFGRVEVGGGRLTSCL